MIDKLLNKSKIEDEDPLPGSSPVSTFDSSNNDIHKNGKKGKYSLFSTLFTRKTDTSLREAIEHVMENDSKEVEGGEEFVERTLITNILDMRDLTSADVMIPRADIVALDSGASKAELFELIETAQHTRFPVYTDNLDNIIGTIHIKDILLRTMRDEKINIQELCRSIPIVSPAMPVFDLLIQMQETKKHMVLVVDEYGGIDGMVTLRDIIEDIVGDIDDEYNIETTPTSSKNPDGTIIADAKTPIEEFESDFGEFLTEDEREEHNTLAGVVVSIAGHVPVRGEVIVHKESGTEIEIIDADPRRINRLKIKNLPATNNA